MMTTRRCYLVTLAVARLAWADARFGSIGGGGPAIIGNAPLHHQRLTRSASTRRRENAILLSTLRGGGNGIEENPDYDSSNKDDAESSNSTSDEEESEAEEEDSDDDDDITPKDVTTTLLSKTKLYNHSKSKKSSTDSTFLGNNRLLQSKSAKSVNKHIQKIFRKNQSTVFALLVIIAFRKDIYAFARKSGLIPTTLFSESASTNVLKLLLVAEVIRRYFLPARGTSIISTSSDKEDKDVNNQKNQTQTTTTEDQPSKQPPSLIVPLLLLLALFFLPRNALYFLMPIVLRMLSGGGPDPDSPLGNLLLPIFGRGEEDVATRMAYLPHLEQHYAFEQLNERYYRDWGAYRKAFPTNQMVAAASTISSEEKVHPSKSTASGSVLGAMESFLSSLVRTNSGTRMAQSPTFGTKTTSNNQLSRTQYPSEYNNGTVIVLDMTKLDQMASRMEVIRDQISFLIHLVQTENGQTTDHGLVNATNITATAGSESLQSSSPTVEVIVLLESPGGGVSQYGLAASHLQRLRSTPNIKLTICIDSVAASGGYMMACMASPGQLYCAPFAMVGSIGVIGQSLNVQKTLESYGVRPYVFRGGKMKNPVGMVGDVTKEGMVAMQSMIDRIHGAFRDHVADARREAFTEAILSDAIPKPAEGGYFQLGGTSKAETSSGDESIEHVMDQVATGDVFLGVQALKLGMVDRLVTSDEYIAERIRQGSRVLKLINYHRPGLFGTSHRGQPSFGMDNGMAVGLFKRVVYRITSALMAWTDGGMGNGFVPNVAAGSIIDDIQIC